MIRERREALHISQADLARLVGISQPSLHNIEIGRTKRSRYMPEIYERLGLDYKTGKVIGAPAGSLHASSAGEHNGDVVTCPVYKMRPGPTGEMMLMSEPTEYVIKPALLTTVTDAFGIGVSGEENYPAYKRGDIVFVHPYQEPIIGSDVVLRPINPDDLRVAIGELEQENAAMWRVKPYNAKAAEYKKNEWRCERIVGKYNRS